MKNLLGQHIPTTPEEILLAAPYKPCAENAALLAFSGGNDSRTLAHVVKKWFSDSPYILELVAIDTGLSMDLWKQSVLDFSEWIDIPVSFFTGEGRDYYTEYVSFRGWPGNAVHSQVQTHLKGRAYREMVKSRRSATPGKMKKMGVSVWILSGVRKAESRKRMLLKNPYSYREGAQFINPLFYWTNSMVCNYMDMNKIPLAPGIQWDCKCGATVRDAILEWRDIEKNAPSLKAYLAGIHSDVPWSWGKFDKGAHKHRKEIGAGQMWFDDGSLASYPTCVNCVNDLIADEETGLDDW